MNDQIKICLAALRDELSSAQAALASGEHPEAGSALTRAQRHLSTALTWAEKDSQSDCDREAAPGRCTV